MRKYALVPSAFTVRRRLVPLERADGSTIRWGEEAVESAYPKDYDAVPGHHPCDWPQRFDTSTWIAIVARQAGVRVAGAVVACGGNGLDMLEGRQDLALIWDLRVAPAYRRQGLGLRLLSAAQAWASERGCRELKVETQDINVPACRLYERFGLQLRAIHPHAYRTLHDECQLLFYKTLALS